MSKANLSSLAEGIKKRSQMEVEEGKVAVDHEGKHLDEAERLALADSTGKAVHSNSKSCLEPKNFT